MPVSDIDIMRTAHIVIKQHGASAAYFAAGRADDFLEADDLDGAGTWRRILAAIEDLQREERKPGETVQ